MRTSDSLARVFLFSLLAATATVSADAQDCTSLPPPATCTEGNQVDALHVDCFGCPLGDQDGTWSCTSSGYDPLQVPRFALAPGVCGSLIQVDVTVEYEARVQYQIENLDNKQQPVQATLNLELFLPDLVPPPPDCTAGTTGLPGVGPLSLGLNDSQNLVLGAFDGTIDFGGTSGDTRILDESGRRCFRFTDPGILQQYVASSPPQFLTLSHRSRDFSNVTGPGNLTTILTTDALVRIIVTYRSCECAMDAVNDEARVCVGATVNIPVLANDSATCGRVSPTCLAYVGTPPPGFVVPPSNGRINFNATGIAPGVYQTNYRICNDEGTGGSCSEDLGACCDEATITVTVCETVANDDPFARVCVGSSVLIDVLANDTTTCGSLVPGSLTLIRDCPGFTVENGRIRYTNTGSPTGGTVECDYRVCNNLANPCCDTATVTVTICRVTALDDSARVCAGSSVLIDVLDNDSTNCGELVPGTLELVNSCTGFAVENGQIRYTNGGSPSCGEVFCDYRIYNAENPACFDTARVTVTICSVTALDDTTARVCAGSSVLIPVLANDTTCCGVLVLGTLELVGNCPGFAVEGNQVRYTNTGSPSCGTVSCTYRICNNEDPRCCDTALITVTICSVTADDEEAEICVGDTVLIDVLKGDTTCCGAIDPGSLELVGNCPGFVVEGNQVRYTNNGLPSRGTVTCTYTVCNDQTPVCCDTGTITVTILSPIARDDDIVVDGNTTFPLDIEVLANDTPSPGCTFPTCKACPGGTPCAVQIVVPPLHGTATVLALAVCTVRYTPDATFSGEDSFTYEVTDSCGCPARARVRISACRSVDRATCGSLLLYPEYDNRQGALTLFTLTNACCEISDGNLSVEMRFIDKDTCTEFDSTFTLTPCDTVSFLTSTVNPNVERGYAYAFAKRLNGGPGNPGGMPIVRNKLIGQLLIIDGIETLDYSMNAVSFLGLGDELSDNDEDFDGIRDLNGPHPTLAEYEQAPDEILIPRFLGQDPAGMGSQFHSQLLLIALSGGSAFTTTVRFLVYNDSEDTFSHDRDFYCWDKRPLIEWAPSTESSFLTSVGDDPEEILGAESHVAGWMRLDGLTAFSSQESINDPAIYAVLVESFAAYNVADLPFERCAQGNGDLLPVSPLGDGPMPVAGDDQ